MVRAVTGSATLKTGTPCEPARIGSLGTAAAIFRRRNYMPSSDSKKNKDDLPYTLALIRATLEATADGMLATDDQGQITSWNTKFVAMWRVPQELVALRDVLKAVAFIAQQLKDSERYPARIAKLRHRRRRALICSNWSTNGLSRYTPMSFRLRKGSSVDCGVFAM